ncbi:hypothetical protein JX265_006752 [Neoarthrinium moseri]|uniref:Glycosyl transferase CAP10 domain-containing protein n=1 Tax=Neoarthrinium moseri TaxID=1658444 RepID=A0A9P9WKR5_9PEZI|nr:hypothetical protein JX265_006752 [Neoarthrinium moseri]
MRRSNLMFHLSRLWRWLSNASPKSLATFATYSVLPGLIIFLYLVLPDSFEIGDIFHPRNPSGPSVFDSYLELLSRTTPPYHPIDELILESERSHDRLLLQRSPDLRTAAAKYRERRGRHPPPGFDKWVEYALKHDAIILEQFFDRIEHDMLPYWAKDPIITAAQAASGEHLVRVRNGAAYAIGDTKGHVPWLSLWTSLIGEAAEWLPDVDMPINYMDEPRILVPWDDINALVGDAELARSISTPQDTIQAYSGLKEVDVESIEPPPSDWVTGGAPPYWDMAREGCPPESTGRDAPTVKDFTTPPAFPLDWRAPFSQDGFVKNYSASMDPCAQPHLNGLHGTFIEPITTSTSRSLVPMFSGCKLPMNNDILIPGAMYLVDDAQFSGGWGHGPRWDLKQGGVVWRGVASGGRHKEENWKHFQRLRLVQMLNGSTVSNVERHGRDAETFPMPPPNLYNITDGRKGHIGEWISTIGDAGFTNFMCFPVTEDCVFCCNYLEPYYRPAKKVKMGKQFRQKFMPDVDGNSYSARFRALLLSTSLPLKSTIYAEWHDDRLVPWLHFAPLDNTLQDLYAVLDYFTADEKGDIAAQHIAESGKAWAEKVLRREDMLLYIWRLLLEFARVCDKNRDRMGYVNDLL